jgi:hypothetical protein
LYRPRPTTFHCRILMELPVYAYDSPTSIQLKEGVR